MLVRRVNSKPTQYPYSKELRKHFGKTLKRPVAAASPRCLALAEAVSFSVIFLKYIVQLGVCDYTHMLKLICMFTDNTC